VWGSYTKAMRLKRVEVEEGGGLGLRVWGVHEGHAVEEGGHAQHSVLLSSLLSSLELSDTKVYAP